VQFPAIRPYQRDWLRRDALALDPSRLPRITSTILNGLRNLETELAGDCAVVRYAALPDTLHQTAQRWAHNR
jgi:sulfate permease, SulP family